MRMRSCQVAIVPIFFFARLGRSGEMYEKREETSTRFKRGATLPSLSVSSLAESCPPSASRPSELRRAGIIHFDAGPSDWVPASPQTVLPPEVSNACCADHNRDGRFNGAPPPQMKTEEPSGKLKAASSRRFSIVEELTADMRWGKVPFRHNRWGVGLTVVGLVGVDGCGRWWRGRAAHRVLMSRWASTQL